MTLSAPLLLRPAAPADTEDLRRLAALDSAPALRGPVLVAQRGERLLAALAVRDGRVVADPFSPTADVVALLRHRAAFGT